MSRAQRDRFAGVKTLCVSGTFSAAIDGSCTAYASGKSASGSGTITYSACPELSLASPYVSKGCIATMIGSAVALALFR